MTEKKFIYVLAMGKCGTHQLGHALRSIEIESHSEFFDIKPVYLKWMRNRFTDKQKITTKKALSLWGSDLLKVFKENDCFADTGHLLGPIYPVVDELCRKNKISVRSIHLTRSFWPHRLLLYNDPSNYIYSPKRVDVNTVHAYIETYYYCEQSWCSIISWEEWLSISPFERLCRLWTSHNEYFLLGNRKIFHSEDFNNSYKDILYELYPEATSEQQEVFRAALYRDKSVLQDADSTYSIQMTLEEKNIYDRICGPTLEKLGYGVRICVE